MGDSAGLYIVGVHYSDGDSQAIERVRVMYVATKERYAATTERRNVYLGGRHELPVKTVRDILRAGHIKIGTATRLNDGWKSDGAEVTLYGDLYLTTSPNAVERDNLGELPEF